MNNAQKEKTILQTAKALCNANNTFSTLELKNELRKKYPNEIWNQIDVSMIMMDLADQGEFDFTSNGTYRTYFAVPSLQGKQKQSQPQNIVQQLINSALGTTKQPTGTTKQPTVDVKIPTKRIGRNKALEIIQNTKGKFFSVRFEKKNGEDRLMGVQYIKGTKPDPLGYVLLRDIKANKSKSVNLQTLSEIKTNGTLYKVK